MQHSVLLTIAVLLCSSASGSIVSQQLLHPSLDIETYSAEWFLRNLQHQEPMDGKAIFYTHGAGDEARKLACSNPDKYVTIWDIWHPDFYDATQAGPFHHIHSNEQLRRKFYSSMSEAYASLARRQAIVMHAREDFTDPPMDGIWGETELPALRDKTDVVEMTKRSHDGDFSEKWWFSRSEAQIDLVAASMERVEAILQRARTMVQPSKLRRGVVESGSCRYWRKDERKMLEEVDRLFG